MTWHDRFIAVDTETTGLGEDARIVEIAVALFERGEYRRGWTSIVRPAGVGWDHADVVKALAVNGLSRDTIESSGRPFAELVAFLNKDLGDHVVVCHNAAFDMRMINQEFERIGSFLSPDPLLVLDTMTLDHVLKPDATSRKLAEVAARWECASSSCHRAHYDAITCGAILANMVRSLPSDIPALRVYQETANKKWEEFIAAKKAARAEGTRT